MIHEPECEFDGERDLAFICKTCDDLQSAYKRGRKDAAHAVFTAYMGQELDRQALNVWVNCRQAAWGK